MIDGIKIYTNLSLVDRLTISNGTEIVSQLNGKPAHSPTFVPKEPWQPLNGQQLTQLKGVDDKPAYQSIALLTLPKPLIKSWQNTGIHQATNEAQVQAVHLHPNYSSAIKETGQWASTFQLKKEQIVMHNLACIPKDLRTVTFNPKEDRYLGLHLDSWEKQPLDQLSQVRNRLCINLGQSARYFLFINQEIKSIQKILGAHQENRARTLIQDFLTKYPDYPVIRIKLNPFEAYLAPTENLIHDGSSEGQTYQDVQITLRSYFQAPAKERVLLKRLRHFFSPSH
jgi:hypothetical protein